MVDGRIVRVHSSTRRGKKTAARRSDGQVPRRLEHKNSCNGGCLGQSGSLIAHPGETSEFTQQARPVIPPKA
jgi:hypothetical protein